MPNYSGTERRRFVRIPFWFVTQYRLYPYEGGTPLLFRKGIGKDISVGGICFEADESFPENATMEVELDMPALDHSVHIIGQVVWARPREAGFYIYGLAFTKIKPEDVKAVKKIVEAFS